MRRLLLCLLVMAGCQPLDDSDGGPIPLDDSGLELRAFDREAEVAIGPDGETPWVRGSQGGTMIRPVLVLPSDGPYSVGDEVDVRLTHAPDPGAPGAFGIDEAFRVYERPVVVEARGGKLVLGPLDDQLGWTALDGVRLTLHVEIEGLEGALERRLSLYNPDPPVDHACYGYAPGLGEGGCSYATVPGTARLTAVSEGENCGATLTATFEPDDEDGAACLGSGFFHTDELTAPLPLSTPPLSATCLESLGHEVGTTSSAVLTVIIEGGCPPGPTLEWTEDVASCACP